MDSAELARTVARGIIMADLIRLGVGAVVVLLLMAVLYSRYKRGDFNR